MYKSSLVLFLFTAALCNAQSLYPANDAKNISPDTTLRMTFAGDTLLGTSGKIQIFDASDNKVVDTIDLAATPSNGQLNPPFRFAADRSAPPRVRSVGGLGNYNYYPVIVTGNQAEIFPAPGSLVYGKSYYVTVDAGVLGNAIEKGKWSFSTKAKGPEAGATKIIVASDGTGDFATVQAALDYIPDGNTTPTTIFIKKGTYTELVYVTNKHGITLLGEDRKQTVIQYATNNNFSASAGGGGYRRGTLRVNRCNDFVLAHLTVRNPTPQGGSQAECIIFNGTPTSRAIVANVDLYSFQDTLQINGQAYISNCYIEGDVDFMWGTGPCFFENCTARTVRSGAYYTQIRNPGTNHGYVYYKCTFDGLPGIMGNVLSRIDPSQFPKSEVVLIDCALGPAVSPAGWLFSPNGRGRGPATATSSTDIHFLEFNSHDLDGKPIDARMRHSVSKQLKQPDDAQTIANYSNPTWVLGSDWDPKQAAIFKTLANPSAGNSTSGITIASPPIDQLALVGTSPYFSVTASGSGQLKYQWSKDGQAIGGATSPMLQLSKSGWEDAGVYLVTITDSSGSVSTNPVNLRIVAPQANPAPQLPAPSSTVFNVTAYGAVGDGATDNTASIQKAIAAAIAAGGGVVQIPFALKPFLSGPISLGNGVNLQIDSGAVLQALPYSPEAKPPVGFYPLGGARFTDFVTANNAHDVSLTGSGTIDGHGQEWWRGFRTNGNMPHRPYMIRFSNCERVLVSGLKFVNSPMFHVAMNATNNLTIFGIRIESPETGPNTDGIDPSGQHHLIQNCIVSVGDDNVVMKPGGTFCSDITVADCWFGEGHGMSVGGQSNRGLDGMTVKNITFNGTGSALRLKADPTQGGEVKNITYSNLVMTNVDYPIVFYSYYNRVGNPGSASGGNQSTPEKVKTWNATPPNPLNTATMPSWKNITVNNLISTGTRAYGIIYGLPLSGYYIENVRLNNVRILDGPGFEIYDATDVQFTGNTDVGKILTVNALAIIGQPQNQSVAPGGTTTFTVTTAGTSGVKETAPTFQWNFNDAPLKDGAGVAGATTATLKLSNVQAAQAGRYTVTVSNNLDAFDTTANALVPDKAPVSMTSAPATLSVGN